MEGGRDYIVREDAFVTMEESSSTLIACFLLREFSSLDMHGACNSENFRHAVPFFCGKCK